MKTKTDLDARVLAIIEPIASDMALRIVRLRVMAGRRPTLQIMAERISDGQMLVEDCEALSRAASSALEVEDPIRDAYILEVSSPGLERPLTSLEDFKTYEGFLARIELDRLVEGRKRFRGILAGIDGPNVDIDLDGDTDTAQIPFEWISEAKLLITDELIEAGQKARAALTSNEAANDASPSHPVTDQ
jgi:ribosome maturation factor RimP